MRSRLFALGGLIAALSTVTALGVRASGGGAGGVGPVSGTPPQVALAAKAKKEGHPELRQALRGLQNAKTALVKAARDFGGHRAKAQELTEQAIQEVQAALKSDTK